ncbi:hypothetical protein [Nocardiopsis sp. CA-288880]|uniref:hypothetical protein n=1 Tax=Nocardiopsis sp. CA-288880 TaxID=3239995 RepID=UPI003D98ED2B
MSSPSGTATQASQPPPGPVGPRRRAPGAMRGIGFMPSLWITDALRAGLLPSTRAHTVAAIIADAADADGRWCYLYLDTIAERSGGTMSASTVKRALHDLVGAGLVRRLGPSQARLFFRADIAAGRRWPDRLPPVLELLIPAQAYTAQALEEVNRVRRVLGEEPLSPVSRPCPPVRTTVHPDPADRSERPADLSPVHPSPIRRSVRGSATTGRVAARAYARGVRPLPVPVQAPVVGPERVPGPAPAPGTRGAPARGGPPQRRPDPAPERVTAPGPRGLARSLLARIPDSVLRRPGPDREALAGALDRLAGQGMRTAELGALLEGAETLRSPFPALMRRLGGVKDARGFLDGRLGAGVRCGGGGAPAPPWAPAPRTDRLAQGVPAPRRPDDGDAFAEPPGFAVGPDGAAPRTCPDHPGVRNVPGGSCRVCGGACRSVPGEILHPRRDPGVGAARTGGDPPGSPARPEGPVRAAEDPAGAPLDGSGTGGAGDGEAGETDPAVLALMRASLAGDRRGPARPPVRTGRAPTPAARAAVDSVRRRLDLLRGRAAG